MSSFRESDLFDFSEVEKLMAEEEKARYKFPCCYNCSHCYTEYGETLCKVHDYPLDDGNIMKCEDWN